MYMYVCCDLHVKCVCNIQNRIMYLIMCMWLHSAYCPIIMSPVAIPFLV